VTKRRKGMRTNVTRVTLPDGTVGIAHGDLPMSERDIEAFKSVVEEASKLLQDPEVFEAIKAKQDLENSKKYK
jgi:hypothetical protein